MSDDPLMPMNRPPERIVLDAPRIVLRRHGLDDIDPLQAVLEGSRDHLRPFMPWADQARDETAGFVRRAIDEWDRGENFNYLVTKSGQGTSGEEILGGCGLHRRGGPGEIEIGYWLRPDATGRGLMTAAAAVLTDVSFATLALPRVEIRCDQANVRSAAVPRRLGFFLERFEDRPIVAPGEHGRQMVWVRQAPPS